MTESNATAEKWMRVLKTVPTEEGKEKRLTAGKVPLVESGNEAVALVDGPETYRAMYAAIQTTMMPTDSSRYYIYLLAWWLDGSFPLVPEVPQSTMLALFEKATANGVQVRVMLWYNLFRLVRHPLLRDRINQLPKDAACILDQTPHWRSHHQKVLVVRGKDGLLGFCGGVDISEDRLVSVRFHPGSPYHDIHCRLKGEAVRGLVNVFEQRWDAHPKAKEVEKAPGKGPLRSKEDQDSIPRKAERRVAGKQFVAIARTFNSLEPKKECAKEYSIQSTLVAAIRAARRLIYIEDQYLIHVVAAQELNDALMQIRSLNLVILIPHSNISDLPSVWERRRQFLSHLLKGQKELSQRVLVYYRVSSPQRVPQASRQEDQGNPALAGDDSVPRTAGGALLGEHSYVHSKLWIVDDELALIGSANCNKRGWSYDSEVMAAIFDLPPSAPSFARRLRKRLWSEHLGIKESQLLDDPTACLTQWRNPSATSLVRPYDPNEDRRRVAPRNGNDPFSGPAGAQRETRDVPDIGAMADQQPVNLTELLNWIAEPPGGDLAPCVTKE